MKRYIRIGAITLALVVAAGVGMNLTADETAANPGEADQTAVEVPLEDGVSLDIPGFLFETKESLFANFQGKVTMIEQRENGLFIRLENEDGVEQDMVVQENTVFAGSEGLLELADFEEGDVVSAFYVVPQMMTMIYPPQYQPVALVKGEDNFGITVEYFDDAMLNSAGDLYVRTSEDTEILDSQGNPYDGDLTNKGLVVYASIVMESFPAQTVAEKIIVLDFEAPEMPQPVDGLGEITEMPFFFEGVYIEGAKAYVADDGAVYFPLRSLAEAMGYTVEWNAELQKVMVGVAIQLSIGDTEYIMGRMMPVTLAAPIIVDDLTYVPAEFFTELLGIESDISGGTFNLTEKNSQE